MVTKASSPLAEKEEEEALGPFDSDKKEKEEKKRGNKCAWIVCQIYTLLLIIFIPSLAYFVYWGTNRTITFTLEPGKGQEWDLSYSHFFKYAEYIRHNSDWGRTEIKLNLKSFDLKVHGPHLTKIEFDLGLTWFDPRLAFGGDFTRNGTFPSYINMKQISPNLTAWTPDIRTKPGSAFHHSAVLLWPNGKIYQKQYHQIEMNSHLFDQEKVTHQIDFFESKYFSNNVALDWDEKALKVQDHKDNHFMNDYRDP